MSHPVDLICIQNSNLNSSSSFRIPGFSVLRSDRIHSRSGILSRDATHASGGVIIFVRQGFSFSELFTSPLSSLDLYSNYVRVNISLNNFSLSFLNVYAPPIRSSPTNGRTNFILPSSRNLFILGDFSCHPLSGTQEALPTPEGRKYSTGSSLLTSSPSMTLTHPRSFPDIFFSCSWEVLQDLGSDHLPIVLSIPLSPVFRPIEPPSSFNYYQKARWDDFASYFDSHCPSTEKCLSLSSAAALYLCGTECSQIFHAFLPHQTPSQSLMRWKVPLVKDARLSLSLTEVKIARLTSPLLDAPRQSKLRHGRRLALLFHSNQTQKLYALFSALSLALLPPLLISPTALLPGRLLPSRPIT